jgi:hypothetical protein
MISHFVVCLSFVRVICEERGDVMRAFIAGIFVDLAKKHILALEALLIGKSLRPSTCIKILIMYFPCTP